jgi:hypothetical protein
MFRSRPLFCSYSYIEREQTERGREQGLLGFRAAGQISVVASASILRRRFVPDGHVGRFNYRKNGVAFLEVHSINRAGCDDRSHRPSGSFDDNLCNDLVRYNLLNRAG